jgi:putative oxidoreductase
MSGVVAIPLAITMIVAAFIVHADDPFGKKELALLYLSGCLTLIFTGAGKFSVDGAVRG